MSDAPDFAVRCIEALTFDGPALLRTRDLMSPFVWRQEDGRFGLLLRVVEDSSDEKGGTGAIWYGVGTDGLHFCVDDAPILAPEPGGHDAKGCEDPTLVHHGDAVIVFYSGVDGDGETHLLWASGPDVHALTRRGPTHKDGDLDNIKEAEVVRGPGGWIMGFEYAEGEASRIGYANGDGPTGPWHRTKQGFGARAGCFDSWHLSTGPMVLKDSDRPVMFYNGATREAEWAVGWVVFDLPRDRIAARCDAPLVEAPRAEDGRRMAFAASAIERDDAIHLYLSFNDRSCHRVTLDRVHADR